MTTIRRVPPAGPFRPQARATGCSSIELKRDPLALLDPCDLRIFASSHPNCLLIGPDAIVDDALTALKPFFRYTPAFLGREPIALPSSCAATLVVRDVGDLTASQQAALSSWMECAPGRAQVISTTPTPIVSAVEARSFLASLYYRLNLLTITLVPPGPYDLVRRNSPPEARNLLE